MMSLKNFLTNSYENGEIPIGFSGDAESGISICSYKYEDASDLKSKFIVKEFPEPMTEVRFGDLLNSNPNLKFKMTIEIQGAALLVMEKTATPNTGGYVVVEYPRAKMRS